MDPITAIGGIASVVQLTKALASFVSCCKDVANAPQERNQLIEEASSTLKILEALVSRNAKHDHGNVTSGQHEPALASQPLDSLSQDLTTFIDNLNAKPRGLKRVFRSRLTWTADKNVALTILNKLERTKALVTMALTGDVEALVSDVQYTLDETKATVEETQAGLSEIQKGAIQRKAMAIQRSQDAWLSELEFRTVHREVARRRQRDTGQWLLDSTDYTRWKSAPSGLLACHGMPGAGKTVLASLIIDELVPEHARPHYCVAYLYCNWKEHRVQTAEALIGCLLKQLLRRSGNYQIISKIWEKREELILTPEIVTTHIKEALKDFRKTFIIIDALDECQESDGRRDSLLRMVTQIAQLSNVVVTWRYSEQIKRTLAPKILVDIQAHESDIRKYVEGRIESESRLRTHVHSLPSLKTEIVQGVIEAAQGMFLLARLHMSALAVKLKPKDVQQALRVLPKTINETYDEISQRIKKQHPEDVEKAFQVLSWVVFTRRLLTVDEQQHALGTLLGMVDIEPADLDDKSMLISLCAGLLDIDQETQEIRLVHYTAQQYFETSGMVLLDPEADETILHTCLRYMSFEPFGKAFEVLVRNRETVKTWRRTTIGGSLRDLERLNNEPKENHESTVWHFSKTYPFVNYASAFWGDHCIGTSGVEETLHFLTRSILEEVAPISPALAIKSWRCVKSYAYYHPSPIPTSEIHDFAAFHLEQAAKFLNAEVDEHATREEVKSSFLLMACSEGYINIAQDLLAQGVLVDRPCRSGLAPLHYAISCRGTNMTELLLANGADVDVVDAELQTPLMYAVRDGDADKIRLLLQSHANVNSQDGVGETALHWALWDSNEGAAQLLLQHGADVQVPNQVGQTPTEVASKKGIQILESLPRR